MKTTYYVTKYALSDGIYAAECKPAARDGWVFDPTRPFTTLKFCRDCFRAPEEAEADAKARAAKRLQQLENQLATLKQLAVKPKWRAGISTGRFRSGGP